MTRNGNYGAHSSTGAGFADSAQALRAAQEHHRAGRLEDALACYAQALALAPDDPDTHFNCGQIQLSLGRLEEALASFDRVVALQPHDAAAHRARGVILQGLARFEDALAGFDAALAIEPDDAEALIARGSVLHALGRYDDALDSYERAQALQPANALGHWNEALCRLAVGDYARGWEKYEWRWKWSGFSSPKLRFREPLWLGRESLEGRTILLHGEQGLGDTLQFARYVPLVAARGAKVVLMVQKLLRPLFEGAKGVERVLSAGEPLPPADYHAPLLSLPLAFGTTLANVPANVPYLAIPPERIDAWRQRLSAGTKPLVGVCWRGSADYRADKDRSIPLARFAPLLSVPGLRFIGLQKEVRADEHDFLPRNADFLNPGESFGATAEIIASLDLVITVDTAFAHLAGALGRPVWILLPRVPHWCWMRERTDSPWYPTARLFRQPVRGDWESVLRDAVRALSNWRA